MSNYTRRLWRNSMKKPKQPKTRECSVCKVVKPLKEFIIGYERKYENDNVYGIKCRACLAEYAGEVTKRHLASSARRRMLLSSANNAFRKGLEHTIKLTDIPRPEFCCYLGVRLDYRCAAERGSLRSWKAPSIDRIDSSRGYVPGNIQVISDLANRMKSDATIPQMIEFARGVLRTNTEQ